MHSLQGLHSKLLGPIENVLIKENYKTCSVVMNNIEPDGSFLGQLQEITIKGETDHGSQELKLFIKTMPQDGDVSIYSMPHAYRNENYMYAEFGTIINQVQDEANLPVDERFLIAKSYPSKDFEIIILENLTAKGYEMFSNKEVVTLKFAELAINQLAKYHSFAFILKKKRPTFFEDKVRNMKQPFFYGQKSYNDFVKNFSRISLNCLNPEQKQRMEEFLPNNYDKYNKYTQNPADIWTMVHGDFRQSNVMVRFTHNEVNEVMVIDYQHAFYGCSIIDFIYFIIAGTDQEFRRNHLEHLKNYYYDSMKKFLKLFNMDVEMYYPRDTFEKSYKEKLDYGLMVAMWLLPVILADKGEIPDVTKVDLSSCDFYLFILYCTTKNCTKGGLNAVWHSLPVIPLG